MAPRRAAGGRQHFIPAAARCKYGTEKTFLSEINLYREKTSEVSVSNMWGRGAVFCGDLSSNSQLRDFILEPNLGLGLVSVGDWEGKLPVQARLQESSGLCPKTGSNSGQHRLVLVACA